MLAQTPLRDLAIAWLEQQDPNESYHWANPHHCACAKMAKALDRKWEWLPHASRTEGWARLNVIARGPATFHEDRSVDWTYGAFLKRLREAQ